ncbi:MAG: hypothetical protein IJL87_03045, partial [Clostridia bacterium]|nr:hypothetical protein [Clostridia bacterium]
FSVFTGFFVYKRYGKLHSLFTLGIIIACSPFYIYHCARNGDADALFLLFFSLAVMLSTTKKFFWCGGLCLALCFLTKSWHAGCALLIIILYQLYLYFKRDRLCLKQILYFFAALLFPVLLWAIIRYANDGTKFFTQMVKYDLLARTDRGVENHVFGVGFYFKYLAEQMPLIFLGLIAVLICAAIRYKKDVLMFLKQPKFLFLLMWICVPFIIFTLAKTKLYWYILPCAAGIVVLTGILLGTLVKNPRFSSIAKTVLLLFFAVFICRTGARNINRFLHPSQSPLQTFISQNCDSVKGYNAYIECYDENGAVSGRWSQSAVFVAEISGDLYCIDGGAKEFLGADTDSRLIIILNNRVGKYDFSDYYICASDDNYCMLIPKGGEMNE